MYCISLDGTLKTTFAKNILVLEENVAECWVNGHHSIPARKVLNFGRKYENLSTSFLNNLYLLYFVVKYSSVIIESQL